RQSLGTRKTNLLTQCRRLRNVIDRRVQRVEESDATHDAQHDTHDEAHRESEEGRSPRATADIALIHTHASTGLVGNARIINFALQSIRCRIGLVNASPHFALCRGNPSMPHPRFPSSRLGANERAAIFDIWLLEARGKRMAYNQKRLWLIGIICAALAVGA